MKMLFIITGLVMPTLSFSQVYEWGSSERYRKEDSLFLVWQSTLPKGIDDSTTLSVIGIISDTIQKIKLKRNIEDIVMLHSEKREKFDEKMRIEMPYLIEEYKRNRTSDSSKAPVLIKVNSLNEHGKYQ